jgi:hypothetical protein
MRNMFSMSKTSKPGENKGGRPRTDATPVTLRVYPASLAALDNFRREETDVPTRPEAVRRLVDDALRARGFLK